MGMLYSYTEIQIQQHNEEMADHALALAIDEMKSLCIVDSKILDEFRDSHSYVYRKPNLFKKLYQSLTGNQTIIERLILVQGKQAINYKSTPEETK
jgi:hypothetical protein